MFCGKFEENVIIIILKYILIEILIEAKILMYNVFYIFVLSIFFILIFFNIRNI